MAKTTNQKLFELITVKQSLTDIVPMMSAEILDGIEDILKESGLTIDDADFVRKGSIHKPLVEEGERAAIQYVSTRDMDRDKEIVVPKGVDLSQFKKAPVVLWGHDYKLPPLGSDEWIIADERGILAKSIYSSIGLAQDIFTLKQEGHLRTSSIGFIPLMTMGRDHGLFGKTLDGLRKLWPELKKTADDLRWLTTKALLLEHSDVSVPMNINALTIAVSKGSIEISDDMQKRLGLDKIDKKKIDEMEEKAEKDCAKLDQDQWDKLCETLGTTKKEEPEALPEVKVLQQPITVISAPVKVIEQPIEEKVKNAIDLARGAV